MIETHNLSSNGPIVDAFKLGKEILILCGGTFDSIAIQEFPSKQLT
jgi:hypothetical protein